MNETDSPNQVVHASRQVLEHKLLTALGDENTVAILASREDLDLLIRALRHVSTLGKHEQERKHFWLKGMEQLRREAFGK